MQLRVTRRTRQTGKGVNQGVAPDAFIRLMATIFGLVFARVKKYRELATIGELMHEGGASRVA